MTLSVYVWHPYLHALSFLLSLSYCLGLLSLSHTCPPAHPPYSHTPAAGHHNQESLATVFAKEAEEIAEGKGEGGGEGQGGGKGDDQGGREGVLATVVKAAEEIAEGKGKGGRKGEGGGGGGGGGGGASKSRGRKRGWG